MYKNPDTCLQMKPEKKRDAYICYKMLYDFDAPWRLCSRHMERRQLRSIAFDAANASEFKSFNQA